MDDTLARVQEARATPRLLVAEDDAVVALDLKATLRDLGYEVTEVVGSGDEALRAVEENPPDLALLDIRMPGSFDGIDVGRELMRRKGIPVVYVTAYGDEATLSRALEESPYGYVLKPYRRQELESAIRVAMERRDREGRIRASEEQVRATLKAIGEGVVATDPDGRIRFMNPAAERLVGLSRSQAEGRPVESVTRFRSGKEAEPEHPVREALSRRSVVRLVEGSFLESHDGKRIPVSDSAAPIVGADGELEGCVLVFRDDTELREKEEALQRVEQRFREMTEHIQDVFWITSADKEAMEYLSPAYERIWGRPVDEIAERPEAWLEAIHPEDRERVRVSLPQQKEGGWEMEYRVVRPDGEIRWVQDRAFPVRDEDGRLLRVVGVAEDVTERVELTRRQMQRQKMEAVGQLAGGVAHDFNNLLTVIRSQTEMVLEDLPADSELRAELDLVRSSAERAKRLTSHLLAFSRQQVLRPEVTDINTVLRELGRILDRLLGEDVEVVYDLRPDLPPVRIDVGQLEQAVVNLAVNARQAMPAGGTLILATSVTEYSPDEAELSDVLSGTYVTLTLSDDGIGMAPEIQEQAFEPFFTTKDAGEGTGLGLAMVYGLARQSGGRVQLESQPGEGTTVALDLPAVDEATASRDAVAAVAEGSEVAEGHVGRPRAEEGARIFLVEDDPVVSRVVRRILERVGMEVESATSAEDAIRAMEDVQEVNVLVTDLGLPGMKGPELIRELRAARPGLPVVAISGYPKQSLDGIHELPDDVRILAKPFTPEELLTLVRAELSGGKR